MNHDSTNAKVSWNKRDLLLYAVGIGAKKNDLQFVYGEISSLYHAQHILIRNSTELGMYGALNPTN